MIIEQALKVMKAMAEENLTLNLMLWGSNGIGKTTVFKTLAKNLKWHFHLQPVPSMDRTEIAGIPFQGDYVRKNGEKVLVQKMAYPEYIVKAMDGDIVILFDEVNRAPKECVNSLLEVINERSINGNPLSKSLIIGLTGNPPDERNFVKMTDSAFNDRVVHILIETDADNTISFFESLDDSEESIHKDIISYLKNNKSKLNSFDSRDSEIPVKRFASPRNWKERVNVIWKGLNPVREKYGIKKETILELIEGTLGEEAANFIQFVESKNKPITLNQVLNMSQETWEKIKMFSNLDENGDEKQEQSISELGFFHPVCAEIEDIKNKELVEKNIDKILLFLSEIPVSFSFSSINKISMRNPQFFLQKFNEIEINPETNKEMIDPISGEPKKKWRKLLKNAEKMKKTIDQDTSSFISSKDKKNNPI